jgi:uncharacterized membrane protein YkoI
MSRIFPRNIFALMTALSVVIPLAAGQAQASTKAHPKITMAEARAIALKAYPATIVKEELEHERGGSGLRYSFDMRQGKSWREVGVDAMTGHILENTAEAANPKD